MTQTLIALIYLPLVVAVSVIFFIVWKGSKRQADAEKTKGLFSRIQTTWLVTLLIIGIVLTLATIPLIHYPGLAAPLPEQTMTVEAFQFGWALNPRQIKASVPVEFVLTSKDVNHGFGVMDAGGNILFEVQAMPKYTNKAVYTFEKPGTYTVACLEYCGLAHHVMIATFEVVP